MLQIMDLEAILTEVTEMKLNLLFYYQLCEAFKIKCILDVKCANCSRHRSMLNNRFMSEFDDSMTENFTNLRLLKTKNRITLGNIVLRQKYQRLIKK